MLHYAVVFFVIALIAAALGFRGVAGLSAEIGWVFAVIAIIFLVVALFSGRVPAACLDGRTNVHEPASESGGEQVGGPLVGSPPAVRAHV